MFSVIDFYCALLYYNSFFLVFYYRIFVKYFNPNNYFILQFIDMNFFALFHFDVSVISLAKLGMFSHIFLMMSLDF